jgi:FO synthase
MYLKGKARKGPTFREAVLMHSVARLVFHGHIHNIQASWVKMGHEGVKACLNAGCNDLGGTLMNESISRAAGTQHGQETSSKEMRRIVRSLNRNPRQRATAYGPVTQEREQTGLQAGELAEIINTPAVKYERKRPSASLVRNDVIDAVNVST